MAGKKRKEKKAVTVDTKSGSMAYNRLDMQVSQCLHMAIELYPNLNYLLVLDHYDDIALFDNDVTPQSVSYYQMKSSEDSISIDTAISEAWIAKMYEQLSNPEWLIKELGLITNCPLKVTVKFKGDDGKTHSEETKYSAERTPFEKFNSLTVQKIKNDIAERKGISAEDVDLSKFFHMRTTLSIPKHREIVEQEMSAFLQKEYPRITVESVKTIFAAMLDLLTKRQEYELLPSDASFVAVREKKGLSKKDFSRVIEDAMMIALPDFDEIQRMFKFGEDEKYKASYEYYSIFSDLKGKSESFTELFFSIRSLCIENPKSRDESMMDYSERIYKLIVFPNPIYSKMYIFVLIGCIVINQWRRYMRNA